MNSGDAFACAYIYSDLKFTMEDGPDKSINVFLQHKDDSFYTLASFKIENLGLNWTGGFDSFSFKMLLTIMFGPCTLGG